MNIPDVGDARNKKQRNAHIRPDRYTPVPDSVLSMNLGAGGSHTQLDPRQQVQNYFPFGLSQICGGVSFPRSVWRVCPGCVHPRSVWRVCPPQICVKGVSFTALCGGCVHPRSPQICVRGVSFPAQICVEGVSFMDICGGVS